MAENRRIVAAHDTTDSAGSIDRPPERPDAMFQVASGVYGGVLLAGIATILAGAIDGWPAGLESTSAGGFLAGALGGFLLARVDERLPIRLGRSAVRRVALALPALVFLGTWFAPFETPANHVTLVIALLVFASGYALSQLAGNRYVDAMAPGNPERTWEWEPVGTPVADIVIAIMWAVLAIGNAAVGNWLEGLVWLTIAGFWVGSCLAEGRWSFGPGRERCEVQCYETGLVRRRPYTKRFVAWDDVGHVRLRNGELVLDSGLRDVRFDRDELADADAFLEAVDERLTSGVGTNDGR
ncbi:hypothetical protein [Natronorubrum daqingense]|uniref:Uncharacterized protein n=1 Tax=Natronorubrum daqingense TaxID=588898 RepID=A0A1N7EQ90_9EURY|nr:hypothetical protein [Natronorubrum daqingense]APX97797.1 hypothetical protein BB347_14870 [Natronorubrum daqingense]SIR90226.1 hypothetical protein SAMN05421809_2779 [Natronorubrum daqingense]